MILGFGRREEEACACRAKTEREREREREKCAQKCMHDDTSRHGELFPHFPFLHLPPFFLFFIFYFQGNVWPTR